MRPKVLSLALCLLLVGCAQQSASTDKTDAETLKRRQEISAIYERWQNARKEQEHWNEEFGKLGEGWKNNNRGYSEAKLKEMDADDESKKKFGVRAELLPQLLK